jgi:hypothetical protein
MEARVQELLRKEDEDEQEKGKGGVEDGEEEKGKGDMEVGWVEDGGEEKEGLKGMRGEEEASAAPLQPLPWPRAACPWTFLSAPPARP